MECTRHAFNFIVVALQAKQQNVWEETATDSI